MKKSLGRRLVLGALIGLVVAFLVTALPVLAMRWMDPWYSAFMLDAALDASLVSYTHLTLPTILRV